MPERMLNGITVNWVGERASRAPASLKEQIEIHGFLLKVYKSHDKCCRALDKKATIASTNAFLVSEAEAEPFLLYLHRRGAKELRIIVDAEASAETTQALDARLTCLDDCLVTIGRNWVEVQQALRSLSAEAMVRMASGQGVGHSWAITGAPEAVMPAAGAAAVQHFATMGMPVPTAAAAWPQPQSQTLQQQAAARAPAPETLSEESGSWTLIWISDLAYKPSAGALKAQLEALGCQIKGYKTYKNATRALDKKRKLVRTVVLVSESEAPQFLQYLESRPELNTQVVVESISRAVPIVEGPTCQIAENFDAAVVIVQQIAMTPGFA